MESQLTSICHNLISHQLTASFLQISQQHFSEKRLHNQQKKENAFQEIFKFQNMDFYSTAIHLFLIDKNVLIVMVHIVYIKQYPYYVLDYSELHIRDLHTEP